MDRRDFLSASAAALAAPTALLLGDREASATDADWHLTLPGRRHIVEEDCSWRLPEPGEPVVSPDGKWHSVAETYDGKRRIRYVDGVMTLNEARTQVVEVQLASTYNAAEYDKDSEHLAELINDVRSPDCELDPVLMAGSLQWAKTMAARGWKTGGRRRRRRRRRRRGGGGPNHDPENGAAEIVATSGDYKSAVVIWRGSPGHARIMYSSRYKRMGAGVAKSKGGAWFMVARFT